MISNVNRAFDGDAALVLSLDCPFDPAMDPSLYRPCTVFPGPYLFLFSLSRALSPAVMPRNEEGTVMVFPETV